MLPTNPLPRAATLRLWQRFHFRLTMLYGGGVLLLLTAMGGIFYSRVSPWRYFATAAVCRSSLWTTPRGCVRSSIVSSRGPTHSPEIPAISFTSIGLWGGSRDSPRYACRRLAVHGRDEANRSGARRLIEGHDIAISPVVLMELELLREIGRTKVPSTEIFAVLSSAIGLVLADAPLSNVIAAATPHAWTRDPFDRMIVGTAATLGRRLLTADRLIRKHFSDAVWA